MCQAIIPMCIACLPQSTHTHRNFFSVIVWCVCVCTFVWHFARGCPPAYIIIITWKIKVNACERVRAFQIIPNWWCTGKRCTRQRRRRRHTYNWERGAACNQEKKTSSSELPLALHNMSKMNVSFLSYS